MRLLAQGRKRGMVFALMAVGLTAFLACAAIAIDVGHLAIVRQSFQSASDLAALGACATCDTASDDQVRQMAADLYAANSVRDPNAPIPAATAGSSFTDAAIGTGTVGATYTVGGDTITVWHPYRDSVTDAKGLSADDCVRVQVDGQRALALGPAVGVNQAAVSAAAVARLDRSGGKTAVFAIDATAGDTGVDWTSSGATVNGDIHSNTGVDVSGNSLTVTGLFEYRNAQSVTGGSHDIQGGMIQGNVLPDPLGYTVADFAPYDYVVRGNYKLTGPNQIVPSGVYRVYGNVSITGQDEAGGPVTFVADGTINVSGSDHQWQAARHNVLFLSLSTSKDAIKVNAQGGTWQGIFYAPNGGANVSASASAVLGGGICAQTVDISANGATLTGMLLGPPGYRVKLIR
jgi:hypothetical protein